MPRKSTATAAACAAALIVLSGCQFFGIDTRPEIRYVTEKERKNITEPMYSMPVAGTNLFKQWPMRLGPDYGIPPWEKKRNGAVAENARTRNGVPAHAPVATATTSAPPENANPTAAADSAAAAPNKAIALAAAANAAANKPTSAAAKPSHRATPRLASGDPAQSTASPTTAHESWNALRNVASRGDGIVVADDLDVPLAAQSDLEFRTPSVSGAPKAQPKAAAALVAPAGSPDRKTRPPVEENLAWGGAASDDSGEAASVDADSHAASAPSGPPSASGVALQQPGAFAARKLAPASSRHSPNRATTSKNNVLRDDAVRPANAESPVTRPKGSRPLAPRASVPRSSAAGIDAAAVSDELVPPAAADLADDPLANLPRGLTEPEANRTSPRVSTRPAPRVVAPATMADEPTRVDERQGTYRPRSDDPDDTVFVTASDMPGDALPYGDASQQKSPSRNGAAADQRASPPRVYTNPYVAAEESSDSFPAEAGGSFDRRETSDKLSELEAAKRRILQ